MRRILVCLLVLADAPALAVSEPDTRELLAAARELLGVPWQMGGRMRRAGEGIDCQGVVFYALERIGPCNWRSFSTRPTRSNADNEIGKSVAGLDPVATGALDVAMLEPGDMLRLVGFDENPKEPAIGEIDGRPVWVWHGGLYSGAGNWIVGDHFAGEVIETPLLEYLRAHDDGYAGVFVNRMARGPRPRRCKKHAPMRRPVDL